MTKILLVMFSVLCAASITFFFLWRAAKTKQKSQKETIDKLVKQVNEAIICQAKLESTIDIMKKNRRNADEKISGLHKGNSAGNALSELRKRRN